jgi:hypothetical protein
MPPPPNFFALAAKDAKGFAASRFGVAIGVPVAVRFDWEARRSSMMLAGGSEPERDSAVACLEIVGRRRANLEVVGDLWGGAGGTTAISAASSGVASTLNNADVSLLVLWVVRVWGSGWKAAAVDVGRNKDAIIVRCSESVDIVDIYSSANLRLLRY